MFCYKCGNEIPDGQKNCPRCGVPVDRIEDVGQPSNDIVAEAPDDKTEQKDSPRRALKKKRVLAAAGLIVAATIIAVVLLIVFLTAGGQPPKEVVRAFYTALQKNDSKALQGLASSQFKKDNPSVKLSLAGMYGPIDNLSSIKFSNMSFKVKEEGDKATVTMTAGKELATPKPGKGKAETFDIKSEYGDWPYAKLVKEDGEWRISGGPVLDIFRARYFLEGLQKAKKEVFDRVVQASDSFDHYWNSAFLNNFAALTAAQIDAVPQQLAELLPFAKQLSDSYGKVAALEGLRRFSEPSLVMAQSMRDLQGYLNGAHQVYNDTEAAVRQHNWQAVFDYFMSGGGDKWGSAGGLRNRAGEEAVNAGNLANQYGIGQYF